MRLLSVLCALALLACSPQAPRSDTAAAAGSVPQPQADASRDGPMATTVDSSSVLIVYKSPTCGCCKNWVDHMRENGFQVISRDVDDMTPVKARHGITETQAACHTGLIGGYVVEGHVPAVDVRRLLREQPTAKGLAVPGMPIGSPGMEGPFADRYEVLLLAREGSASVYARH